MSLRPFLSYFSGPHTKVALMGLSRTDIKSSTLPFPEGNHLTNTEYQRGNTLSSLLPPHETTHINSHFCCCLVTKSCLPLQQPHGLQPTLQAPLSLGFSRQEYWSGLPFSPPEDLSDPGIESMSPAWQVYSLPLNHLECFIAFQQLKNPQPNKRKKSVVCTEIITVLL